MSVSVKIKTRSKAHLGPQQVWPADLVPTVSLRGEGTADAHRPEHPKNLPLSITQEEAPCRYVGQRRGGRHPRVRVRILNACLCITWERTALRRVRLQRTPVACTGDSVEARLLSQWWRPLLSIFKSQQWRNVFLRSATGSTADDGSAKLSSISTGAQRYAYYPMRLSGGETRFDANATTFCARPAIVSRHGVTLRTNLNRRTNWNL